MQKFLMTTALVIPLSVTGAWAQTATTDSAATPAPAATTGTTAMPAAGDAMPSTAMPADAATTGGTTTGTMPADTAAGTATGTMPADTTTMPADTTAGTMPATTETMPAGTATTTDTTTAPAATTMPATTSDAATTTTTTDAAATPADVMRQQAPDELRVDWITGTEVTSTDGERVGTVTDVIVDGNTSMMKAAVVGVGGFLGIGEKQIAIDWSKLKVDYDANRITTNITRDEARSAPSYQFRQQAPVPAGAVQGEGTSAATQPVGTTTAPAAN